MPGSTGRRVLIVEDEAFIAMAVEDALLAAGYTPVGPASSEAAALRFADAHAPSLAVLDINLGQGGSGLVVGRTLAARGVTVLFATGNGQTHERDMQQAGARAWLGKPYDPEDIPRAFDLLAMLAAGKLPRLALPRTFHMLA
jgi:DNA-binding response OmpR family regulator